MGAKNYDFADDMPEYRESNRIDYRSKGTDNTRKRRKAPRSRANVKGIHNRRNKHMSW